MASTCFSGVSFNGLSGDKAQIVIPEFNNIREAEKFAISNIGIEQVRRALRKQALWYRDFGKVTENPNPKEIKNARFNHSQAEFCERAYNIMTQYKQTHVGAYFYAGVMTLKDK